MPGLPSARAASKHDSYASPSDSASDTDDLPYPAPLPRSAFLAPDFTPETYLGTLRNRHQTLEDLRTELRSRVRDLGQELVDLVNAEYEDLLSVGTELRGGEDKVEGVRVGLLGFRREIAGLRSAVGQRRGEVEALIRQRQRVRRDMVLGKRLVEVDARLAQLSRRLGLGDRPGDGNKAFHDRQDGAEDDRDDDEDEDEDNDDDDRDTCEISGYAALRRNVQSLAQLNALIASIGRHPFIDAHMPRVKAAREALLLDLGAALRAAQKQGNAQWTLLVVLLYRDIEAYAEAIKILQA